ncbi:MAG: hypothetical protein HOP15_07510 [Planctomycetes bacterium]|nr:hypothetical protein [Planctomycetota bacterium]
MDPASSSGSKPVTLRAAKVLFRVPEPHQGGVDLNGDGDAFDVLLHALLDVPH